VESLVTDFADWAKSGRLLRERKGADGFGSRRPVGGRAKPQAFDEPSQRVEKVVFLATFFNRLRGKQDFETARKDAWWSGNR
jgi:hypothetical protein